MKQMLDLDHHDGEVDFELIKGDGIDEVYLKATEGITFTDPKFEQWAELAQAADLDVKAYHFFRPDDDGEDQAHHFLSIVGGKGISTVALDLEWIPVNSEELWDKVPEILRYFRLQAFIKVVKSKGYLLEIYTSTSFVNAILPGASFLGEFPLWLAHYATQLGELPKFWKTWKYWQFTEHGHVEGVEGDVDVSNINEDAVPLAG